MYCPLAFWALQRFPMLRSTVFVAGSIVLLSVSLELVLSLVVVPLELHRHFDGIHSVLHFTNVVLVPPAIACIILLVPLRWRGEGRPLPPRIVAIGYDSATSLWMRPSTALMALVSRPLKCHESNINALIIEVRQLDAGVFVWQPQKMRHIRIVESAHIHDFIPPPHSPPVYRHRSQRHRWIGCSRTRRS